MPPEPQFLEFQRHPFYAEDFLLKQRNYSGTSEKLP